MNSSTNKDLPILVIGAGVGGLAFAQGLLRYSIPVRVFERHPEVRPPQGQRFRIRDLHAQEALENVLSPELQDLMKRTMAERHAAKPGIVDATALDYKPLAPPDEPLSMPVDRNWIITLLSLSLEGAIEYEKSFVSYTHEAWGVRVMFSDGTCADGRLLVGADGLRSRVRQQLQPYRRAVDIDRVSTWGRTPITSSLEARLKTPALKVNMTSMIQDRKQNVVCIVDRMFWNKSVALESCERLPDIAPYFFWGISTSPVERLPGTTQERKEFLLKLTESWHPDLKAIFGASSHDLTVCTRILSSKPDLELRMADHRGKIMLIGDAAHWISPMGGAGGATAIEDAADLAKTIHAEGITTESMSGFVGRMEERGKKAIVGAIEDGERLWGGKKLDEFEEAKI